MGNHKHVLLGDYSFQLLSDLFDVSFLLFRLSFRHGVESHLSCIKWLAKRVRVGDSGKIKSGWGQPGVCIRWSCSRYCRENLQIWTQSATPCRSFTLVAGCPLHSKSSSSISVDIYYSLDCWRCPLLYACC